MAEDPRSLKRWEWWLLGGILLLHAGANVVWVLQDWTLRSYDAGPHLEAHAHAYGLVTVEGLRGLWEVVRGAKGGGWPTAGYLPSLLLTGICGECLTTARLSTLPYLAVLLVSVFWIGRRLGGVSAGLLAASLVMLYPAVYGESRQFGADFPGAAMTTLTVALLLATERFGRRRASVLLGLGLGFGVLVRPQAMLVSAVPIVVVLGTALWEIKTSKARRRVLLNAALGLATAAAVASPWWLGRLSEISAVLTAHAAGLERPPWDTGEPSLIYYVRILPWCFSFFLLAAAAVAFKVLWDRRRHCRADLEQLAIWAWLLGGLGVLSLFDVRSLRYMLPLGPALALLTALGLASIPYRGPRRVVVALAVSVATGCWFVDSFLARQPTHLGLGSHRQAGIRSVTHGPPFVDPVVQAADELGWVLQRAHPVGQGVRLHLRGWLPDHEKHRIVIWKVKPVLRLRLPAARIIDETTRERDFFTDEREVTKLGEAWLAASRGPSRHCYLLTWGFSRDRGPVREQLREMARELASSGRSPSFAVWRLKDCQFQPRVFGSP